MLFTPRQNHASQSQGNRSNLFFQPRVQTKLEVDAPDSAAEKEADHTADKVVQRSTLLETPPETFFSPAVQVQRKPENTELENAEPESVIRESSDKSSEQQTVDQPPVVIQQKPEAATVHTSSVLPIAVQPKKEDEGKDNEKEEEEEEETALLQKKEPGNLSESEENTDNFSNRLNNSKSKGSTLDNSVKSDMEGGFGTDFSNVRIHTDAESVKMNQQLGSQAFTQGNDIYFNEGKYDPSSDSGKHLLAHELTHTVQQGTSGSESSTSLQRSVEDFTHSEDTDGPVSRMDEKLEDAGMNDPEEQPDEDAERPSRSEIGEQESDIDEDAKPDADREAENAPKIEENAEKLDQKVEEGPELEGETTEQEPPEEKEAPRTPAERAKAASEAAFARSEAYIPPEEPVEVEIPEVEMPKDSKGEEVPVNPAHLMQVAVLLTKIQVHREKAYELKAGAVAKQAKSEELEGTIQGGYSGIHESNEVIDVFLSHSEARRENVDQMEEHLEESDRRVEWVSEEAPGLTEEATKGSEETASMAEETAAQEQEVSNAPEDPETSDDNAQTQEKLGDANDGAVRTDEAMRQTGEMTERLTDEAAVAREHNMQTGETLTSSRENIERGETKLHADQDLNRQAIARLDAVNKKPDEFMKLARKQEQQADEAIEASFEHEREVIEGQQWYLDQLAKTPPEPEGGMGTDLNEGEGVIQKEALPDEQARELAADRVAREAFLETIDNEYERQLVENQIDMVQRFDTMTSDERESYALEVAFNNVMAGVTEGGFAGFTRDMLAAMYWPPATGRAMWHLMWPEIPENDPGLITAFRYAAGWTSAAAVLFGSLWAFSLAGFLIGSVLSFFLFTAPVGIPMVGIFSPLMSIFGALFEMAAYISAIFHLLVLAYDLEAAGNARTSAELSSTSDQVADDVNRGMVAYLGTLMVIIGPALSRIFGRTPMGRWWGRFREWAETRQTNIKQQLRGEAPAEPNTGVTGEGETVPGEETTVRDGESTSETEPVDEVPVDENASTETEPVSEAERPAELESPLRARILSAISRLRARIAELNGKISGLADEIPVKADLETRLRDAEATLNNLEARAETASLDAEMRAIENELGVFERDVLDPLNTEIDLFTDLQANGLDADSIEYIRHHYGNEGLRTARALSAAGKSVNEILQYLESAEVLGQVDSLATIAEDGTLLALERKGFTPDEITTFLSDAGTQGAQIVNSLMDQGVGRAPAIDAMNTAARIGQLDAVHQLVTSGNLDNVAGLRNFLREVESELAVGLEGKLQQLLDAAERSRAGRVGIERSESPSGEADVIDHTTREAVAHKRVTSRSTSSVAEHVRKAGKQLRGETGEVPPPGYETIADIRIVNPDNPMFNMGRAEIIEALRLDGVTGADLRGVTEVRITNNTGTHTIRQADF